MAECPHKRIRPLGEGAVGDVHLCVDVFDRRLVVVKWLRAEVHENSEAAVRFTREADLMLNMHLNGVIRVETWNVDDYGRTWMAMEFVDGLVPSSVIRPGDGWAVHRLLEGVQVSEIDTNDLRIALLKKFLVTRLPYEDPHPFSSCNQPFH